MMQLLKSSILLKLWVGNGLWIICDTALTNQSECHSYVFELPMDFRAFIEMQAQI